MSRVSNEQILTALTDLPSAIAIAMAGTQAEPILPTDDNTKGDKTASVDAAYMSHMVAKVQARANSDGNSYVLYARTNKANQTKLAYCVADKWTGLTDKRILGPVKTVSPE